MTKVYPNNLTWEQWELIADIFLKAKLGGRSWSKSPLYTSEKLFPPPVEAENTKNG